MSLNPLSGRRTFVLKRELKVHVASTLIWWALFCGLAGVASLATAHAVPWRLLAGALPLIAIVEGVYFLGSVLRA